MNSRVEGSAIGAGSALAQVRESPSLVQVCESVMGNINALRHQHQRISDAICRLQNPRPVKVDNSATPNHPPAQTLEGRLQEINRELESLLNEATGSAMRLDEAV